MVGKCRKVNNFFVNRKNFCNFTKQTRTKVDIKKIMNAIIDNRNNIKAPIFAISRLRFATDGPGITTLVTFMGCPLKCKYCINKMCHKPIYEEDKKAVSKGVMMLTPQELYEKVKLDNIYFQTSGGGICFGGGEPTLYPEFIEEFKKLCYNKWKITLETCGRCSYKTYKRLSLVVDYWIVDIKSMNVDIYKKYTKRESRVEKQLYYLHKLIKDKNNVTIKVPYIPYFNEHENLDIDIEYIKKNFGFNNVQKTKYIIK